MTMRPEKSVFFLVLPHVHLLDLSGPVQALFEANAFGGKYDLRYCSPTPRVRTAQGMWISDLEPLPGVAADDLVLVPGIDSTTLDDLDHVPVDWLRGAEKAGATVGSICSGGFILAYAGLLDGKMCTTHWKIADRMQAEYPETKLVKNRLYVRSGRIITSAGVASGIDMALSLVEEDIGPLAAAHVARELVVYMRRNGESDQSSVYLQFRTHLHPGVHRVQDWLVSHPDTSPTIDELARVAGMSPRHLTRSFRQATGITLKEFATRLKLEIAESLFHDPNLTVEGVAAQCGFKDPRQLRRLWKRNFGTSPSVWKRNEETEVVS